MQKSLTELLDDLPPHRQLSLDAVLPQVYDELHRLASAYMRGERSSHTLQPTALVNETYLRMLHQHSVDFSNRAHVIGIAAKMMRRILRTHEEQRKAGKRGGEQTLLCLADAPEPSARPVLLFGEVDEALERLTQMDERQGRLAELRIFGGLTTQETADFLGISLATAHRDWVSARLWLASELELSAQA